MKRPGNMLRAINNKQGSMLILSLIVSAIFIVFSSGYLALVIAENNNTERIHCLNTALHLAESGVEEAVWEIKYNGSAFASANGWSGSNPKIKTASLTDALGNNLGSYSVSVTNPASTSPVINSEGSALFKSGSMSDDRTIEVALTVPASNPYEYAAFADSNIYMDSNACTDAYNSTIGPYDGPNGANPPSAPHNNYSASQGDIGSNSTSSSTIYMDSDAMVYGDAFVGVGGNPSSAISTNSNADITGNESALSTAKNIPSVIAPTGLTNHGDLNLSGSSTQTISSSGQYRDIHLDSDAVLTVTGNTTIYLTRDLIVDSNAQLVIASGADVEIYVDNSIVFNSNAEINNISKDPSMLAIYGTDTMSDNGSSGNESIQFNSNAQVHATVHAKNATVLLDSDTEVYGAVMSDGIHMNSNACIHYDLALSSGGSSGSGATVSSWQEK